MEIPGENATWTLLSDEEEGGQQNQPQQQQQQQQHLYAPDLPPLGQDAFIDQAFHQAMVAGFDDSPPAGLQEFPPQQFQPQADQPGLRCGSAANDAGDLASVRRVHKADREKLRRDKLNEQFTELASALDPDRPKNDKATILSDSVQELNELRAVVKRLKKEHAALLDESRDLSQEKSELREEKAFLKSETDQLNSQLQQRLRLALSWPVDPSLMLGASAFPYPLPVPAAPAAAGPPPLVPSSPSPAAPPSSQPQQQQQQQQPQAPPTQGSQIPPPPIPFLPPGLPLPPPYGIHPYAMFANRPPAAGYFPYFSPPSSTVERPFAQYATPGMHPFRGYTGQDGAPAFFPPSLAAEAPYKPLQVAPKATREDNAEPGPESQQQSSGSSPPPQVEASSPSSVEVKQEVQVVQPLVKSLSPTILDGSSDSNCVA
ncbi:protein diaphanous homolog 1-like [Selaginella moellendorffii]|uniref:protein diaphanous homolog 1-like n=1 Tax=Selaginella moellendorffii TaxID=88036 RepID=UPI000D1C9649|nr:protein diaphanous homolog 1-like [Selaginella moellendorffii]|eukprot:XP_024538299.1 protein diaphanous homolog 1-like [Selaginella moellendorffii]